MNPLTEMQNDRKQKGLINALKSTRLRKTVCATAVLCLAMPAHAIEQSKIDMLMGIFSGENAYVSQHLGPGNVPSDRLTGNNPVEGAGNRVPLPALNRELVLRGEDDRIRWPIDLSQQDVLQGLSVTFTFDNSATVLPEESRLVLSINGNELKFMPIRHAELPGQLSAHISPVDLKPGRNWLTLNAEQYHRVDCSLDATYELWTRVLEEDSWLQFPASYRADKLERLATGPIRNAALQVVQQNLFAQPMDNERVAAYLQFIQKVSRLGGLQNPRVELLSQENSNGAGIDVFVGSSAELINNRHIRKHYGGLSMAKILASTRDDILVLPATSGHRMLVGELIDLRQQEEAAVRSATFEPAELADASLEEKRISLEELGYEEIEYSGKRFFREFNLRLPPDFYPGDYDTIKLHLYGTYAAGLKPGQRFLVHVNGRSSTSIPFSKPDGDVFYDHVLEIPLSNFKPGSNSVRLIGHLEVDGEEACSPFTPKKRSPALFISGSSYFEIPKLARAGQFPGVGNTLTTGFPYQQLDKGGELIVDLHGNPEASFKISAAFLGQIAATAKQDIPVRVTSSQETSINLQGGQADERFDNRLIVAPFDAVPPSFAKLVPHIQWAALEDYWRDEALAESQIDNITTGSITGDDTSSPFDDIVLPKVPIAHTLSNDAVALYGGYKAIPVYGIVEESKVPPKSALQSRFEQHATSERESAFSFSLTGQLKNVFSAFSNAGETFAASDESIPVDSRLVISQALDGNVKTTFIGYPGHRPEVPKNLAGSLKDETQHGVHKSLQTIGYSSQNDTPVGVEAGWTRFVDTEEWTLSNMRLVIAGWLSNNPITYGIACLLVLVMWSFCTTVVLNRTDRSIGKEFDSDV